MIQIGRKYKDRDKRNPDRYVEVLNVLPGETDGDETAICGVYKKGVPQRRTVKIKRHVLHSRRYQPEEVASA